MPTYLLNWNPSSAFTWPNNSANSAATRRGEIVHIRWSTGGNKSIVAGDRIFLGKLGTYPTGVIASGVAASGCFEDTHWEDGSKTATYNMVDFETILDPVSVLPRTHLEEDLLGDVDWDAEYGGVTIGEEAAAALEAKWRNWLDRVGFPQVDADLERSVFQKFGYAGWISLRLHFLLERDSTIVQAKRSHVLKRSGRLQCEVCRSIFTDAAGNKGGSLSECHDKRGLATLESTGDLHTTVDHLALVCANCHKMLHSQGWPSVEDLRSREATPPATTLR